MLKYIVSGTLGAATGSLITYFVMKKRFERRLEAEYAKMAYMANKQSKNSVKAEETASEGVTAVPDTRSKSSLDGGPVFTGQRTDYSTMARNYMKSEKDLETVMAESEAPEEALTENEDPNPIHIISPNEYNEDSETNRVDLYYYPAANVLEDEFGEEVEERELLVGDCLEELRAAEVMPTDENSLVFIRNNNIGVIYAVEMMEGEPIKGN